MSGVVSVEWPARLISSMVRLLAYRALRVRVLRGLDCPGLMRPDADFQLAKRGRGAADDHVAGLDRADAFRCAGVEQVARLERVEFGSEFDQPPAIVDELAGIAFLPLF